MTAIAAASVRVQTMADGTLRAVLDIEPRYAQEAFKMLGTPGTAIALAALKPAHQQQAEALKGGPVSQWLGMRCREPEFQAWLTRAYPGTWPTRLTPEACAAAVRTLCGVTSRAEIDHDPEALERFERLIRKPWLAYSTPTVGQSDTTPKGST